MLPHTKQWYKAVHLRRRKQQIKTPYIYDDTMRHSNTAIYIGKIKCPKCKRNGYLQISHTTQVRHLILGTKTKEHPNYKYQTCTLKSITRILKNYQIFLSKKVNKNQKKSEYDKKRYRNHKPKRPYQTTYYRKRK